MNGAPVNRWAVFKFPDGTSYAYWDTNSGTITTQFESLNDTSIGALANTLSQVWNDSTIGYALFNDEIPNTSTYNFSVGHSKGVWIWDAQKEAGIFIQHSIPKFPQGPATSPNGFSGIPSNAWDYGQHAACFTLSFEDLEHIVLEYIHVLPQIYESRNTFDALETLLEGGYNGDPVCQFFKMAGASLVGFSKTATWNNDLYEGCIAPEFMQGLTVESWLHGSSPLGASCTPYVVADITDLQYDSTYFSNYDDHSKWAIVESGDYVCFSDINRMGTQYSRNGAAFCFEDSGLWNSLSAAIHDTDSNC